MSRAGEGQGKGEGEPKGRRRERMDHVTGAVDRGRVPVEEVDAWRKIEC